MPLKRKPVPPTSTQGASELPTSSLQTVPEGRASHQTRVPEINIEQPPPTSESQISRQESTTPFPPLPGSPSLSQRNSGGYPNPPSSPSLYPNIATDTSRQRPAAPSSRPSSVRIRRLPSSPNLAQLAAQDGRDKETDQDGRRRSLSAPQEPQWRSTTPRADLTRQRTSTAAMPSVAEDAPYAAPETEDQLDVPTQPRRGRFRRASNAMSSMIGRPRTPGGPDEHTGSNEYDSELVDLLDVVDPEVSTLSTLTNVQNSLFIPDLGRFVNRRPTYNLTRRREESVLEAAPGADFQTVLSRPASRLSRRDTTQSQADRAKKEQQGEPMQPTDSEQTRRTSISSTLDSNNFAVLPHGVILADWSEEEKAELNDHVRHQLHSRRAKFKRRMKGFGKYVSKPLGFFVTLYATLITLFGLAWVLFLIGWINVGGRQLYIINIIDNVLVALFAIMGDGLAPFRVVDTYHMIYIAHYHHLTWRLRREKALPKLHNKNDLPSDRPTSPDLEAGLEEKHEFSVLNPEQQRKLAYHQGKFAKSHTFYRPHETNTHYAFPLRLLVAVVVLLDCHSLFQIALGTCTWSINYHHRPFALTTVILCCSISVNIAAGITISVGDRKTRKTEVIEEHFRQGLTDHAIHHIEKKKGVKVLRQPQPSKPRRRDAWKKVVGLR